MKFKSTDDIEEKFNNQYNKTAHYQKRVTKDKQYTDLSEHEYEALADKLALTPVNYRNILGYQTTAPKGDSRVRYAKYNTDTGDFVIYGLDKNGKPLIISMYNISIREFNSDKAMNYQDEIPSGK